MCRKSMLALTILMLLVLSIYSQNRFGAGGGLSFPSMNGQNRLGWHGQLEWDLAINEKLLVSSIVGVDQIRLAEQSLPFQLYKIGTGVKRRFTKRIFFRLGINAALVDNIAEQSFDVYPTLSLAYNMPIQRRQVFSLWIKGDFTGVLLNQNDRIFIPAFGFSYGFIY